MGGKHTPRSLVPIGQGIKPQAVTPASLAAVMASPAYREAVAYFDHYPERSLMGPHSRAVLFSLIRMMQPVAVAEIGTLFAGTTEALARALWENGAGLVHTADPFGVENDSAAIIAGWPAELQAITRFHALNSMAFLLELERQRLDLDLVLVDGNHDYEFALFDLQMAARRLRPGGIIVMDNSDQAGPYQASRAFVAQHPAWRELGGALAAHDSQDPFTARTSLPNTWFILLQAPAYITIDAMSWASGTLRVPEPHVSGLGLDFAAQRTAGTLFYRVFVRAFADANRWIGELQAKGGIRVVLDGSAATIEHALSDPLGFAVPERFGNDHFCTAEIDLAWQADAGAPPLALLSAPRPIGRCP